MTPLTPEDLIHNEEFELLAEIKHSHIKQFIFEQINPDVTMIRWFANYQVAMMALFVFLLVKSIILATRGINDPLLQMGYAILFSFSALVVLHEMIHAVTFWLNGAKKLKVGAFWKKFIFYVVADRQVLDYRTFKRVAYGPFVMVKICCLLLGVLFWKTTYAYFFFSVMCIHPLFCAGDIAMLAFYRIHSDKEIYNFDDMESGTTYFYSRK